MSAPADYEEAAAFYQQTLLDACEQSPHTFLELGSGGGNTASHLEARFTLTLVECSPGMLDVSRALNPECEHVEGDMRTVRLGARRVGSAQRGPVRARGMAAPPHRRRLPAEVVPFEHSELEAGAYEIFAGRRPT